MTSLGLKAPYLTLFAKVSEVPYFECLLCHIVYVRYCKVKKFHKKLPYIVKIVIYIEVRLLQSKYYKISIKISILQKVIAYDYKNDGFRDFTVNKIVFHVENGFLK